MRVGILGGTGPAGRALGTRLAANGVEVVLGSRSAERGEEIAAEVRGEWPDLMLLLEGGSNLDAASCDIVVLATPWEGAVATALELASAL
jgi:8-hydroxy-5-deazaflavin:NADPH oxidoreductase